MKPINDKFEISPEMIERATRVLWDSGRLEYEALGADQLIVKEMLEKALSLSEPNSAAKIP